MQNANQTIRLIFVAFVFLVVNRSPAELIERDGGDFTATRYFNAEQVAKMKEDKRMGGTGEVDYTFTVNEQGWHELWVKGAKWATDIYLDGALVIHCPLDSGVWEQKDKHYKVLNLPLAAGEHTLCFSRPWFPGLHIYGFKLAPATDITGRVRLSLAKGMDRLCFRAGELAPMVLEAGRSGEPVELQLRITETKRQESRVLSYTVPAGEGDLRQELNLPTDQAGVFDVEVLDAASGRHVDRTLQYMVVDTQHPAPAPAALTKELVQTIDCAATVPDYSQGESRVVRSSLGAYRESADHGHTDYSLEASWFAYTLSLPSVQEPYLVEIDYPDDDQRTFTYAIIEADLPGGRGLTHGVASGGIYTLSNQMQTAQLVFYPRQSDPRLLLRTWWTGQRAATSAIRVYRIVGGWSELLPKAEDGGRELGRYQEEPMRFVQWGAKPEGNQWRNIWEPAERIGQYSRYVGINYWQPTIAIYGAAMWPTRFLPSLDRDVDSWGTVGPATLKEPVNKDVFRLMLLSGETYGMRVLGELYMPCGRPVARQYFETRFGGDGNIDWEDPNAKPWLVVHRSGELDNTTLYNPLYPGIQDWVADIVGELAQRYADSPAFAGVGLRFMGWQFPGWQSFASLEWGYGDYTIGMFEQETGIHIPVAPDDAKRFQNRYEWLLANQREAWGGWRCAHIYAYHQRLAKILTDARPDLQLHLDLHSPNFAADLQPGELERRGWADCLRDTGIDVNLTRQNPAILLREERHYPPGIRGERNRAPVPRATAIEHFYSARPTVATARPLGKGTEVGIHFDANSFESNMVSYEALGLPSTGRNTEVHGAGLVYPAGRHYLERFAISMADGNMTWATDGSHGYNAMPPDLTRAFTAEYRRLPRIGMQRLGPGDPAALWYGKQAGKTYFYLVNRCSYPVEAMVSLPAGSRIKRLTTSDVVTGSELRTTLEPYALIGYLSLDGQAPTAIATTPPKEQVVQLRRQLAAAADVISLNGVQTTLLSFSVRDHQRAVERLAEATAALDAGQTWLAWRRLLHPDLVRLYEALHSWPPDLLHRAPHETPTADMPASASTTETTSTPLPLVGIIGDARGVSINNQALAVTDDGTIHLLMRTGRIAQFAADGRYLRSVSVGLSSPAKATLRARSNHLFLGRIATDFPAIVDLSRQGIEPGRFRNPTDALLTADGRTIVADTGNSRVQIFAADQPETPARIIELKDRPTALDLRGNLLAVLTHNALLHVFELSDPVRTVASGKVGRAANAVAIHPDGSILVSTGPSVEGRGGLTRYRLIGARLDDGQPFPTDQPAGETNWLYPSATPMTTGPDGQIWLLDRGAGQVLSLDPQSQQATVQFSGLNRPSALAFDTDGNLLVTVAQAAVVQLSPDMPSPLTLPIKQGVEPNTSVALWGLLQREDGLYVRVIEDGYRKGWPALTFKRLTPAGKLEQWIDFGPLFATRTRFSPWEANYALENAPDGNLYMALHPWLAVMKITPAGKIVWEASEHPVGGAAELTFSHLQDAAVDQMGNIWVVDSERSEITCLSPEGQLLRRFGHKGGVDTRDGVSFGSPTGIAIAQVDGKECLFVGDAGNHCIVVLKLP